MKYSNNGISKYLLYPPHFAPSIQLLVKCATRLLYYPRNITLLFATDDSYVYN